MPKLPPPLKTGNYLIDQMAMDEYKETIKKLEMQMRKNQNSKKNSSNGSSNSSTASRTSSATTEGRVSRAPRKTGGSNYLLDQLNAEKEARRKAERTSSSSIFPKESTMPQASPRRVSSSSSSSSSSKSYEVDLKNSDSYVSTDLSAKAAAEKHKREMASLFGNGGTTSAVARSSRQIYEKQLEADRVNNKIGKPEPMKVIVDEKSSGAGGGSIKGVSNNEKKSLENTSSNQTLDQQRRQELQQIMRDKSLNKEERRSKMDEVRNRYAALALEQQNNGTSSSSTGTTSQEGGEERHLAEMDLSAQSYSQRPKKEIEAIKNSVVPVSERMSKINQDLESNAMRGRKEKDEVAVKDKRLDSGKFYFSFVFCPFIIMPWCHMYL